MPNCRSLPPSAWEQARKALVFYFSRRHGLSNAEDLAQETLAALWSRADYEFDKEEDFLRVCYGFANRISQQGYRTTKRHATSELDLDLAATPGNRPHGLSGAEMNVMLEEVLEIGSRMQRKDWDLIQKAALPDRPAGGVSDPREANRI